MPAAREGPPPKPPLAAHPAAASAVDGPLHPQTVALVLALRLCFLALGGLTRLPACLPAPSPLLPALQVKALDADAVEAQPHKGALEAAEEIRGLLDGSRQVNGKKAGAGSGAALNSAPQVGRGMTRAGAGGASLSVASPCMLGHPCVVVISPAVLAMPAHAGCPPMVPWPDRAYGVPIAAGAAS